MKPIFQRNKSDCVIAAVAMVADKSYAAVKRTWGSSRNGLDSSEIEWLLSQFVCWHRIRYITRSVKVSEWAVKHPRSLALLTTTSLFGYCHALVSHHGKVFCPTNGIVFIDDDVYEAYVIGQSEND